MRRATSWPRSPCAGGSGRWSASERGARNAAAPVRPLRVSLLATPLARQAGIEVPLICGAMYPCSNPELVAAVSDAGAIGIVQPVSMTYVYGHEYREGLR